MVYDSFDTNVTFATFVMVIDSV